MAVEGPVGYTGPLTARGQSPELIRQVNRNDFPRSSGELTADAAVVDGPCLVTSVVFSGFTNVYLRDGILIGATPKWRLDVEGHHHFEDGLSFVNGLYVDITGTGWIYIAFK